jgi:hypothetical protein
MDRKNLLRERKKKIDLSALSEKEIDDLMDEPIFSDDELDSDSGCEKVYRRLQKYKKLISLKILIV